MECYQTCQKLICNYITTHTSHIWNLITKMSIFNHKALFEHAYKTKSNITKLGGL